MQQEGVWSFMEVCNLEDGVLCLEMFRKELSLKETYGNLQIHAYIILNPENMKTTIGNNPL